MRIFFLVFWVSLYQCQNVLVVAYLSDLLLQGRPQCIVACCLLLVCSAACSVVWFKVILCKCLLLVCSQSYYCVVVSGYFVDTICIVRFWHVYKHASSKPDIAACSYCRYVLWPSCCRSIETVMRNCFKIEVTIWTQTWKMPCSLLTWKWACTQGTPICAKPLISVLFIGEVRIITETSVTQKYNKINYIWSSYIFSVVFIIPPISSCYSFNYMAMKYSMASALSEIVDIL